MVHLTVQVSKYLMTFLFLFYTFSCFIVFRFRKEADEQAYIYHLQKVLLYLIHFIAYGVLYLTTGNQQMIVFYLLQVLLISAIFLFYHIFYKQASRLLLNNMCMLFSIGLIMLARLSLTKAIRQYMFLVAGAAVAMLIPVFLQKITVFRKMTWVYAVVGIVALVVVAIAGTTSYGAKLSISIGSFSVQPSEFVKILFVFFIASMLYQKQDLKQVMITSAVSAVFVLALVVSKDLGGALLYFVTYLVMVYVATKRLVYFAGGLGLMAAAAFAGANLFSHVQTRILAWRDPLSVIDNEGYQVSQALFGIGTGGWFGLGLNQGMPKKIPVVENDFIFAAISEEMGGVFSICLIMVCVSCFFMFMNIAMQMKDSYYKLVALGLAVTYAMQVFLTIGGVISYGGSSLLATMMIFGVIQGLYVRPKQLPADKTSTGKRQPQDSGKVSENSSSRERRTANGKKEKS
jgi:cell division protein FtsW (lipid II flippase)